MIGRIILTLIASIFCWIHPAFALQMLERDRIHIYFPEAQQQKASELLMACRSIIDFLKNSGLPPKMPLHIVLDEVLDEPRVLVAMIPHHEIRIPLRAPGVLEDGGNEADPWKYFLFMGLSAQGIFGERSGIPGKTHMLFGEIISPNIILPEWAIDGISFLLYEKYRQATMPSPLAQIIMDTGPIPDLDLVSNHPDTWPGRFSYQIFGRPFIRWLDQRYGWEKIFEFIRLHGKGIIPVEIDSEAQIVFGKNWHQLWQEFREEHAGAEHDRFGWSIVGYWHEPFIYWNDIGVHPGLQKKAWRGRYGYMDANNWLLLSEYDEKGVSKLKSLRKDQLRTAPSNHIWDPGPGGVAVSRKTSRPHVVFHAPLNRNLLFEDFEQADFITRWIEAPPGVIQLSGPVMDEMGRIAVAANSAGNWDIWLYTGVWHRVTDAPSIEMDPWIQNGLLMFASNMTGRFQIHTHDMRQLTHSSTAAIFPRGQTYLELGPGGWFPKALPLIDIPAFPGVSPTGQIDSMPAHESKESTYSPLKSLVPNYIVPDLFFDLDNLQIGLATQGRDVTGNFTLDTGVRYTFDNDILSWRLGGKAHSWAARATRYPFSYTTARQETVDEMRYDVKVGFLPFAEETLEFSLNWRYFKDRFNDLQSDDEWWGSVRFLHAAGNWRARATVDLFAGGSQSLYGEVIYILGERISTVMQLEAGKTWGELVAGHNSFRIGGNSAEGFFTQRPTRLFPLRGFDENILDAGQAVTASIETIWPLAHLQRGYKTLPLFLRNISLGTFIDGGIAGDHLSKDDLLVGAGIELITGMELAWGFNADFRIAWAWPLKKPDDLDQSGAQFLIQIGKPL
ncbi:MAG: hypothetical protein C4519_26165 [Desulfobacteraceae bacterium]|nr:MAG: hypothetical protein C4519_26165 [Desulfobacteraceae bacterium]